MRVKKVNRYYCEFCKKAGCSGGHIRKHETGCTLNPNRVCRMCKMVENEQRTIAELMEGLPVAADFLHERRDDYGVSYGRDFVGLDVAMNDALPKLREAAGNCPACILAALRQRGIPVPIVNGFNFSDECKAVWAHVNETQYRASLEAEKYY